MKRLGFWNRVRCVFTGIKKARPAPKTRREIAEQARTTANRPSTKRGYVINQSGRASCVGRTLGEIVGEITIERGAKMEKRIGDFDQYWIAQIYHNAKTMAAFVDAVHEAGLDRETCTGIWHCIDAAIDVQPVAPQKSEESPTKSPNTAMDEIMFSKNVLHSVCDSDHAVKAFCDYVTAQRQAGA